MTNLVIENCVAYFNSIECSPATATRTLHEKQLSIKLLQIPSLPSQEAETEQVTQEGLHEHY